MKASSNNLRGQMGLRSGPLAPTSAKLTTQYLVLDHMTNHYSKITKARPAIDNKPPRSMSSSQKARDRKTRDVVTKTGKRPTSSMNVTRRPHTSTGYYQDDIYDENLWGEVDPEDEEEMLIHNIMRTTLKGQDQYNTDPTQGTDQHYSHTYQPRQRPSSARSARSVGSGVARSMVQVKKPTTYDGDLLHKRSHVFTEEKPFTPRTLKTDRKSRLSQYKYYNKVPPKDTKPKQQAAETHQEPSEHTEQETVEKRPQPKPRGSKRLDRTREGPVTMNSLMFETLHSRDFSKQQNGNSDIPKLDISMDKDHLKWIKDQASKAHHRSANDTMKSTVREEEEDNCDTTIDYGKTGEMSLTYGTLGSTKTRPPLGSSHRSNPEDEEGLYVRFMKDVTNDIINRGIYTDRAVRQVFKTHMAKNKGILNELRMRQITDDIRQQLNIPRYDIDDDTSYTSMRDNNQNHYGNDLRLELTSSTMGQGHGEYDPALNGTQGSQKSKISRGSTEHSQDTYNFKSTEDDDLYSTIRSDMNNTGTLTDTHTMALRSYQASIKEQDGEDLEEGEVVLDKHGRPLMNGHVEPHNSSVQHSKQSSVQQSRQSSVQHSQQNSAQQSRQSSAQHSRQNSARGTNDGTEDLDEEEDTYEDEVYEDDGDDEDDDDDVMQTTEPATTYRTEDDDF